MRETIKEQIQSAIVGLLAAAQASGRETEGNILTLTLHPGSSLTVQEGYHQVLRLFLQWFRQQPEILTGPWKAERSISGNIFYYVLYYGYIEPRHVRKSWNQFQDKAGLLDVFKRLNSHADPYSIDIQPISSKFKKQA